MRQLLHFARRSLTVATTLLAQKQLMAFNCGRCGRERSLRGHLKSNDVVPEVVKGLITRKRQEIVGLLMRMESALRPSVEL